MHMLCEFTCASEVPEEMPTVEEEGENWAKPLTHLWQSRPPSLKKEREYNQRMGLKPPYCSVCLLFYTYQQVCTAFVRAKDLGRYEYNQHCIIFIKNIVLKYNGHHS